LRNMTQRVGCKQFDPLKNWTIRKDSSGLRVPVSLVLPRYFKWPSRSSITPYHESLVLHCMCLWGSIYLDTSNGPWVTSCTCITGTGTVHVSQSTQTLQVALEYQYHYGGFWHCTCLSIYLDTWYWYWHCPKINLDHTSITGTGTAHVSQST
jgi:hypothetical protein